MKSNIVKSHLKKKSQAKLALSISLFFVLLTATGYLLNSKEVIFLFYIFCFVFSMSSEFRTLNNFDFPIAIDESNIHLILILLSLETVIVFLNGDILFSILT